VKPGSLFPTLLRLEIVFAMGRVLDAE